MEYRRNIRKFESAIKTYYEFEYELLQKYALKDAEGNIKIDDNGKPTFPPASRNKYDKEIEELLNCEQTLDIQTVDLSVLCGDGKEIKPVILLDLDFMITQEDDKISE